MVVPLIQVAADEVNQLVYSYLLDSGLEHSAFVFKAETRLQSSPLFNSFVPRGELIDLLTKALIYLEVEAHCKGETIISNCRTPFSLLRRHECTSQSPNPDQQAELFAGRGNAPGHAFGNGANDLHKKRPEAESNADERGKRTRYSVPAEPIQESSTPQNDAGTDSRRAPGLTPDFPIPVEPSDSSGTNGWPNAASSNAAASPAKPPSSVTQLVGHTGEVFVCAWNPAFPDLLATGSKDATARIWRLPPFLLSHSDAPQNLVLEHLPQNEERDITSVDWSTDGRYLATGSYDSVLRVWSMDGQLYMSHPQHQVGVVGPIFATRFSRSGKWLLSASLDGTACVWHVQEKRLFMQFRCHEECCLDVDWLDDNTFASCGADKKIHVMQIGSQNPIATLLGHTDEVNQIKFNQSRMQLASCSDDNTARIWNVADVFKKPEADSIPGLGSTSKSPGIVLEGHKDSVGSIAWCPGRQSPNEDILATVAFDGSARLWEAHTGQCIFEFNDHTRAAFTLTFSPDGRFFGTGSGDGWVRFYNVQTGAQVWNWSDGPRRPAVYEIDWQQAGAVNRIALCLESGVVEIVDAGHLVEFK